MEITDAGKDHIWKQAANAHFHRWAEHYDRDIINILLFEPCYRRVQALFRHWIRRGLQEIRVLDIGCGTGTLAVRYLYPLPQVKSIVGLDMSENMIGKAREKAEKWNLSPKVTFTLGDAENLPFEDNSFDIVTCCNSFHHYPHQDQAVREMHRVLAERGRLMLVDGCRDNPVGFFVFDICVTRVENHVHHCSAERFKELMTKAGFHDINQQVFGVCPPAIVNTGIVIKELTTTE
jgi:ubiquinone/menaquinone biosynthesis C-methylase UbiE